jgi:hypothetical protein
VPHSLHGAQTLGGDFLGRGEQCILECQPDNMSLGAAGQVITDAAVRRPSCCRVACDAMHKKYMADQRQMGCTPTDAY